MTRSPILKSSHLYVGSGLIEETKALDDPIVEVDEFGFGQFVNLDPHQSLLSAIADRRALALASGNRYLPRSTVE